ncbi:MAG: gas vesicle protein GvpG [Proteobacteria bacterium]|nr:gas vesicle protein GvpG [Pseudomonadota bacterium]
MFLIDDIVLAPMKGILWIFKGINDAVEEERANEAGDITAKLSELYILLETGQMTEAQFDAEEKVLLDRLDAIKERVENMEDEESE